MPKAPKQVPEDDSELQGSPIYPDLEYQDDEVDTSESKSDADRRFEALEASLAERDSRLAALQEQNLALMTVPAASTQPPMPPRQVSYEGLPDPSLDPQAHGVALAERLRAEQQETERYNSEVAQVQRQETERYNAVWADFAISHEDYAGNREQVEWAAKKTLDKSRARGINDQRYVFGHPEKFMQDVVAEYDRIFGKPGSEEAEEIVRVAKKRSPQRATGMIGGMEGGSKPTRAEPNPRDDDMFRDLRQFQLKHGFYA